MFAKKNPGAENSRLEGLTCVSDERSLLGTKLALCFLPNSYSINVDVKPRRARPSGRNSMLATTSSKKRRNSVSTSPTSKKRKNGEPSGETAVAKPPIHAEITSVKVGCCSRDFEFMLPTRVVRKRRNAHQRGGERIRMKEKNGKKGETQKKGKPGKKRAEICSDCSDSDGGDDSDDSYDFDPDRDLCDTLTLDSIDIINEIKAKFSDAFVRPGGLRECPELREKLMEFLRDRNDEDVGEGKEADGDGDGDGDKDTKSKKQGKKKGTTEESGLLDFLKKQKEKKEKKKKRKEEKGIAKKKKEKSERRLFAEMIHREQMEDILREEGVPSDEFDDCDFFSDMFSGLSSDCSYHPEGSSDDSDDSGDESGEEDEDELETFKIPNLLNLDLHNQKHYFDPRLYSSEPVVSSGGGKDMLANPGRNLARNMQVW